ncbi:MAG: hypothetical protein AAF938_26190 [Myxococcota bacterium]
MTAANQITVRFRRLVRGMVRRASDLSFALAFGGLSLLFLRKALVAAGVLVPYAAVGVGFTALFGAIAIPIGARLAALFRRRKRRGSLEISESGVLLRRGRRRLPLKILALWDADQRSYVVLAGGHLLEFEGDEAKKLAALKEHVVPGVIRLDAIAGTDKGLTTIGTVSGVFALVLGVTLRFLPEPTAFSLALPLALVAGAVVAWTGRGTNIRLGTDGLHAEGTFVPYADLSDVSEEGDGLRLQLTDGSDKLIRFAARPGVRTAVRNAILVRARDDVDWTRVASDEEGGLGDEARALVRRLAGGFRYGALKKEELAAVAASSTAPPRVRVASALALGLEGDEAPLEDLHAGAVDEELRALTSQGRELLEAD